MTKTVAFLFLIVVACAYAAYTTKYDDIDLDEILNNERIYKKYFDCLTSKAKCTPDGKDLKDILPDALKTACASCNEKQKKGSEHVIKFLVEKKRADFDVLEKIYDPTGIYLKKYQEEAKKRGIKI